MAFTVGFIVGLFVGVSFGVLLLGMLIAARRGDEQAKRH